MIDNLSAAERETVITTSDDDHLVSIWTAQKRFITKMRKNPQFTEVETGFYGTSEFSVFTIPADRWSPLGVKRLVNLTEQQRNQAATRLQAARGQA
ncbi:MAG TPA: hypothetical protein VJW23_10075 [Propionibacteriaceae bacterium]|nr:hypothetical protein [Propionibacteriaceae bacterium]